MHRVKGLTRADLSIVDGIQVTAPHRTLLDLGSVVSEELVEHALEDALRRGLVTLARLRWTVRQRGGRGQRGSKILRKLLEMRPRGVAPTDSSLEVAFLRLLRTEKFREPERQVEIRESGKLIARVDFAYSDLRVAIEVDSYQYHLGREVWERDLARRDKLTALGWRVIHLSKRDLASGEFAPKLRRLLG
ncbi:MAG: DUF559 domain-containing protein [Actinomycetota bacterium]